MVMAAKTAREVAWEQSAEVEEGAQRFNGEGRSIEKKGITEEEDQMRVGQLDD